MFDDGRPTDPAGAQSKPRLLLALSVALLCHVVIAVVFLLQDPVTEPDERTVQVQLVAPGEDTPEQKAASQPSVGTPPQPKHTSTQRPADPAVISTNETPGVIASTTRSEQKTQKAKSTSEQPAVSTPKPSSPPRREKLANSQQRPSRATPSEREPPPVMATPAPSRSAAAPSGAPAASRPAGTEEYRQESSRPDLPQMDPYQLTLSRHMMRPIKQFLQREPTMKRFNQAVEAGTKPIMIELKLLSNGAVRRVQLKESSGSEFVDRIAVQSALAASPYPPPPEEERANGFRFKLHLIMSPVYL